MTFSTRTWPANGGTAGSVTVNYGPRTPNSAFGGNVGINVVRQAVIEFSAPTTTTSTADDFGKTGLQAAAWAKNGLDLVFPVGTIFKSANVVVETAFNTLTALTIGTYKASDGTTAIDADGLVTAAGSALAAIDAVGDRLVGNGAQLSTGADGGGAVQFASVIRCLYTGTVPTTGKARLIVEYVTPTP